MPHEFMELSLETIEAELKLFLGPKCFQLGFVDHVAPWGRPEVLDVGHKGCCLAVTGTDTRYSTITFELSIDLTQWGKPEILVVNGQFIDVKYLGGRYELWYHKSIYHHSLRDLRDRINRMSGYAIRLLEKYARETLGQPDFELWTSVPRHELHKVVDYFRAPGQLDIRG